jgi:GGDEF domain-containing protein
MSAVVAIVRSGLRGEDMLFRSGDSTMVALMTSMDRATAVDVMNRVSEQLRASNQLGGFPNAAIGVASAPADGVTLHVLLDAARRQSSAIDPEGLPPSVH